MIERLVLENDFDTAFNEIKSRPTRSDIIFFQAQQQPLQETKQAIVSQIAQISSKLKRMEVQRQQDKANPSQIENRTSHNQHQNSSSSCGHNRGGQYNSRGNGRVFCRNFGKRGHYQKFCW